MTDPTPAPPRPPKPAWTPYAIGGGVGLVILLVAVMATNVFDRSSNTTVVAQTTTSIDVTTSVATTTSSSTTTSSTTTTPSTTTTTMATTTTAPAVLIEDHFEGTTGAQLIFADEFNTLEVNQADRGWLTALVNGVVPAMYPTPVGDAEMTFRFRSDVVDGAVGAVFRAEDPFDGAIDSYLAFWINEAGVFTIVEFRDGEFEVIVQEQAPPEANYQPDGFNGLRVVMSGGTVVVELNGVRLAEVGDATPPGPRYVGFLVAAVEAGDRITVDDVVVVGLG